MAVASRVLFLNNGSNLTGIMREAIEAFGPSAIVVLHLGTDDISWHPLCVGGTIGNQIRVCHLSVNPDASLGQLTFAGEVIEPRDRLFGAELVKPGDAFVLNGGTTVLQRAMNNLTLRVKHIRIVDLQRGREPVDLV
jgi:hypothetical protein